MPARRGGVGTTFDDRTKAVHSPRDCYFGHRSCGGLDAGPAPCRCELVAVDSARSDGRRHRNAGRSPAALGHPRRREDVRDGNRHSNPTAPTPPRNPRSRCNESNKSNNVLFAARRSPQSRAQTPPPPQPQTEHAETAQPVAAEIQTSEPPRPHPEQLRISLTSPRRWRSWRSPADSRRRLRRPARRHK